MPRLSRSWSCSWSCSWSRGSCLRWAKRAAAPAMGAAAATLHAIRTGSPQRSQGTKGSVQQTSTRHSNARPAGAARRAALRRISATPVTLARSAKRSRTKLVKGQTRLHGTPASLAAAAARALKRNKKANQKSEAKPEPARTICTHAATYRIGPLKRPPVDAAACDPMSMSMRQRDRAARTAASHGERTTNQIRPGRHSCRGAVDVVDVEASSTWHDEEQRGAARSRAVESRCASRSRRSPATAGSGVRGQQRQ